jgi:hypothetical protein
MAYSNSSSSSNKRKLDDPNLLSFADEEKLGIDEPFSKKPKKYLDELGKQILPYHSLSLCYFIFLCLIFGFFVDVKFPSIFVFHVLKESDAVALLENTSIKEIMTSSKGMIVLKSTDSVSHAFQVLADNAITRFVVTIFSFKKDFLEVFNFFLFLFYVIFSFFSKVHL